jgi:ribose transport system substrate-binding protein
MASQPAHDRHDGFAEVDGKEPGIKLVLKPIDTEWKEKKVLMI